MQESNFTPARILAIIGSICNLIGMHLAFIFVPVRLILNVVGLYLAKQEQQSLQGELDQTSPIFKRNKTDRIFCWIGIGLSLFGIILAIIVVTLIMNSGY